MRDVGENGAVGVVHSLVPFLLHERNEQKTGF